MAIQVRELSKVYPGGTQALQNVSLTIPAGSFVSLLGPSGCGKSTLLAIMAGLDTPTAGRVDRDGQPGMVFQEAALFPWRTIRDNVAFGLQMRGVSKSERRAQADEALKMVHLSRFADAFPHQLSGGMRQRAAIARALVTDPAVLLMDEPFGALDAQTRALLQGELLSVWERTRKTIVFVTHGLDEALALSDKIVLMSARPGRIVGEFKVDAPRPRDPQADSALAALRNHLMELLSAEVEAVARAERDEGWHGSLSPLPPQPAAHENIGAEI
jgi:NitT/TauT family transport system ATP-binding protein